MYNPREPQGQRAKLLPLDADMRLGASAIHGKNARARGNFSMNPSKDDDPLASFRLDDRLIVVTGASQGIGRYLAEGYARAGAHVVLASRRAEKLDEVRAAIAARGG